MNYTLRIQSNQRSFILKQARPYVEKYPSIAAPVERANMEAAFFKAAAPWEAVGNRLPRLLYFDPENHLQMIEDLGAGADFTHFYSGTIPIPENELAVLLQFLSALHQQSRANPPKENFQNRAMRELNHFHIFDFPFQAENGLDLNSFQSGLKELAMESIFQEPNLRTFTLKLGARYLADGDTLLHGDFFPGSWLRTARGIFVIDPEFCFRGEAAFDLGVFMAHLCFCGLDWEKARDILQAHYGDFDQCLCFKFAAVEILRRFFGVAQLPLGLDIAQKTLLTSLAIQQLLNE